MASPGKKSYPQQIDPALWAEIERLAAQELRSANAQVEFLLREALARRGIKAAAPSPQSPGTADEALDGGRRPPVGEDIWRVHVGGPPLPPRAGEGPPPSIVVEPADARFAG